MKILRTIENKYASFSVLLWILILSFWSLNAFSQSSTSLYVGDYTYFSAPNPPVSGAAISQTAWGSRHASVSVEKYMTYGAKVTVNSYFTDKAEIQCDYYYYTYVAGRQLGPYRATTYFYVTCKPVNINLNTSYMNLDVGEGEWLEYSLSPSISHKPTIRMYSSNTRVATVNSSGYVKAEGPGDCVITVENSAGPNATCSVHVNKVDPTDVSLSDPEPIYIGQKVTLTPWLYPDNAQTTFSWKSSDNSVAEVSNGVVTGKSVGTARITVTTANNLSASCNVEVYKPVPSRIELNKTTLRLPVGGKESLSYNVTPSYAIYSVTWESDAPEIVSVNNGNLEAKSPGVANISVVTDNGKKSVCKVTVSPEPRLCFYVWLRNGEVHRYDLEDKPEVKLGETIFTLTTTRQTLEYQASNILRFTLQDAALDDPDGITVPEKMDDVQFREGALFLAGCTPHSPVNIYDTAGRLIRRTKTDDDGNLILSIASLRAGTYIIGTEKTTIKIQKR